MRTQRVIPGLLAMFAFAALARPVSPLGDEISIAIAPCPDVPAAPAEVDSTRHVIHVSIDGLRWDAVQRLGAAAPHFRRLRIEGSFTENARTDYDYTVTLPNHACELVSRPVLGPEGHGVSFNTDDPRTIEEVHGSYVAGAFDVAHDNGLRTACWAGKTKFAIFDRSWNDTTGAYDSTGEDDGRDKIDVYGYNADGGALFGAFLADMASRRPHYSFIHFAGPDAAGHAYGWESKEYFDALIEIDGYLGVMLDLVESDPALAGRVWIAVAADHGGAGTDHSLASESANYTVPLYLWGPGIGAGADLYALNPSTRLDPGSGRPDYAALPQPIRNGEAANICLDILGCPSVPGSLLDAAQDLTLAPPGGLPCVSISAPAAGSTFAYPSEVTIEASASGGLGGVAYVEFFVNGELAGADASAPYAQEWNGAPIGVHGITARAVCSTGAAAAATVEVEISSTADVSPGHSSLAPPRVHPNPAGRLSTISFDLLSPCAVEIRLYDVLGRRIDTVYRGYLAGGSHALPLDAGAHPPGLYFYQVAAGNESRGGKVMIVR